MDEVRYISNKYQPPKNSAKYQHFQSRDFNPSLISKKKKGALHRKRFSKHPLFTTFSLFLTERFVIFQINTDFLINQLQNIFTLDTWHCPFLPTRNLCSLSHKFLETSTFYQMPTSFHCDWGLQYFKQIPTSKQYTKTLTFLQKRIYIFLLFGKKLALSIANVFWNIHFLLHFHYF